MSITHEAAKHLINQWREGAAAADLQSKDKSNKPAAAVCAAIREVFKLCADQLEADLNPTARELQEEAFNNNLRYDKDL